MYEELIKRLRVTCESCKLWDGYKCCLKGECSAQKSLQAADAIEDLIAALTASNEVIAKSKPQWIPVTERLPEMQEDVLCDDDGRVTIGYYTDEEVGWHDMHSYRIYPTHWMPLPQPPESEESKC